MSNHRYNKSTNPFEEDGDVDDETFLRNSRRSNGVQPTSFDEQIQTLQERRRAIEERTLNSTERSIGVLRDSEQVGIATAEELSRQREKLERTDKQLDEINATLRFSQKHINNIKSVFSSLKSYMQGKSGDMAMPPPPLGSGSDGGSKPQSSGSNTSLNPGLEEKLLTYDRYDNHPSTRLKGTDYSSSTMQAQQSSGSKDFSAKLDANLQEMCTNISKLKGLATDLSFEIDSQNDLIGNIIDKTEVADITINRQNKDMVRLLKK